MSDESNSPEVLAAVAVHMAAEQLNSALVDACRLRLRVDVEVIERFRVTGGNHPLQTVEIKVYQEMPKGIKE